MAGVHPVGVALYGVDFAVVDEVAVGVGAVPTGEGVGAEAGVDEGHGRFHPLIVQVEEVLMDLGGVEHPFVDNRPRREAGDVKILALARQFVPNLLFGQAANDEQLALEGEFVYLLGGG